MTIIESNIILNRSIEDIYIFLADFNNHKALMPESIYNWSSDTENARFTIQNMAKLALVFVQKTENKELVAIPSEKAPFDLKLKWTLLQSEKGVEAKFCIEADLNMMMKMIATTPLQKLADYQTKKLKEIFN